MNRRYYMIRAMAQEQADFDIFFSGVVAAGWSNIRFDKYDQVEDLVAAVYDSYYADGRTAPTVVGTKKNEVRRFKRMEAGDRILVPYYSDVVLAEAIGEQAYDETAGVRDLCNQHRVRYQRDEHGELRKVPRKALSTALQCRLRVPGSAIRDFNEFRDEIDSLFAGHTFQSTYDACVAELSGDLKKRLKENLQRGRGMSLSAGGEGLENLVRELLEIEGYDAKRLHKQSFANYADADIEAIRIDPVREVKLLVQVKHHAGLSGSWGAQQLALIKQNDELRTDYELVLITSAEASAELRKACSDEGINLVEGDALADWIIERAFDLEHSTRQQLGITSIPRLLE